MTENRVASITSNDVVFWTAAAILALILVASIIGLVIALNGDARATVYKDIFETIVKGTLLPLFVTLAGLKVGYTILMGVVDRKQG